MNRAAVTKVCMCVGSAALSCALASVAAGQDEARPGSRAVPDFAPVSDEYLRNPDPRDWMMLRGRYEMWGHSELDQIDRDNVGNLTLVWARAMRQEGINQGSPLVYDGVMYLPNAWDQVQALDAATGDLIWQYSPAVPPADEISGAVWWGQRNRSVFLWDDKVYLASWRNRIIALDARNGEVVWETSRGDEGVITNTSGPIVVDGVVIAGGQCQAAPMGCYVTGHDAQTGEELWRHEVIPKPGEPGDETWGNTPMERRWCTGVWGQIAYDPELDLVHYGTSATCPASELQRDAVGATMAGTNTRFAVRPRTGEVVWERQVLPRDNWDLECTFEMMVIDSPVNPNPDAEAMIAANPEANGGETRRTLTGMPCKVPMFWSLDSASGEFFYAKETWQGAQNIYSSIDPVTGKANINEDILLLDLDEEYTQCPAYPGGRNWPSGAYDPERNLLVQPTIDRCAVVSPVDQPDGILIGQGYNVTHRAIAHPDNPGDGLGRLTAIDVETGDTVWSYEQRAGNYAPVLSTAGGLLFNGGGDRYLRAHDLDTGEVVWRTRLGSDASGYIASYEVGGRQYIAVVAGSSAGAGALHPEIDGFGSANMVYVFALPEN